MNDICIQATIFGKVQGVFYRDNTRKKALALQITGWVRNNEDGSVSLHACGEEARIREFIDWLWDGPLLARVNNVVWGRIADEKHAEFVVRK